MAIENTEEEEGDEDHHEKVTDENVVATVAEILSQICWTKCTKSSNSQIKTMFPLNDQHSAAETRHSEKYRVELALTERYKKSAVPYMQRLLNSKA